jgi:hypothetical protein
MLLHIILVIIFLLLLIGCINLCYRICFTQNIVSISNEEIELCV